ncbi:hypothetical protein [Antarctobacter heliothermus]|uniref:Uncharacterized protein n=1 Tax=Antarctobacter heliothermus TaxID=74033 RepID=A0A239EMU3_9RHOB|nr:hypothetical protein [Antarctobacter heliothermus]SNS45194.1 hypothetical protein SAMN04488078_101583 [Antarctobacter heliothermus]
MDLFVIFALILASFLGTGLIAFAVRRGHQKREQLRAFSAKHGWTYHHTPSTGGRGSRTVISDPSEGWELVQYVQTGGTQGGSSRRWTQFTQPRLALDSGLALLGPEIPAKTAAMAEMMLAKTGGGMIGKMLLDRMTGGLGGEAADLRAVSGDGRGTMFATPGCETALAPVRDVPELIEARKGLNEAMQPVVSLGREGLRIKRTGLLRDTDDMLRFVDLGRALSQKLNG